jgi:hypothetical protein
MTGRSTSVVTWASAALVAGALIAPAGVARYRPPPCGAARSHTVLGNRDARVYWIVNSSGVREHFGCAYRSNRRYSLGIDAQLIRLVGKRVAVAAAGGSFVTFSVFDLRNGHRRDSGDHENLPNHEQPVATDLVLKRNGSIAWILTVVNGDLTPPGSEVGRMDSRGETTLAAANDIESRSLRLRGSTLSWRQAGTTRAANLR